MALRLERVKKMRSLTEIYYMNQKAMKNAGCRLFTRLVFYPSGIAYNDFCYAPCLEDAFINKFLPDGFRAGEVYLVDIESAITRTDDYKNFVNQVNSATI